VKAHPGSRAVRCFKIYAECSRDRTVQAGAKGVLHFVVLQPDGRLLDVTCEPGDKRTFCVPAQWHPHLTDDELLSCDIHMGGGGPAVGTIEREAA
tara:strand:+ start:1047 stop:1331 length:285 start_codon:yes stop_codon:yes gene_type:complete